MHSRFALSIGETPSRCDNFLARLAKHINPLSAKKPQYAYKPPKEQQKISPGKFVIPDNVAKSAAEAEKKSGTNSRNKEFVFFFFLPTQSFFCYTHLPRTFFCAVNRSNLLPALFPSQPNQPMYRHTGGGNFFICLRVDNLNLRFKNLKR